MQMNLGFSTNQKQTQHLRLNAGTLLSLEVLRMPAQELSELITRNIYENPLLEIDAKSDEPNEDFAPMRLDACSAPGGLLPEEREDRVTLAAAKTRESRNRSHGKDRFDPADMGSREVTFQEMLNEQLGALTLEPALAARCQYLVACLNRKGFLDEAPADIATALSCSLRDVTQALHVLHSLHPPGVGARSLREYLVLLLSEQGRFTEACTIKLVKEGLPLLARNDICAIAKLLGISKESARKVCGVIRRLPPFPAQGYYTGEQNSSIVPDAMIEKDEFGMRVVMNDTTVPRLELSRDYCSMMTEADFDAKAYFQKMLANAKQLIKAVDDREKTLTRILRKVVELQPAFFEDGSTLRPMSMTSLAEELGLSSSTISRAVGGKYIICAAGTVELKSLFTAGVPTKQGQSVSCSFIKQQIRNFIHRENPTAPLPDEQLREALQLMDINISRRTVAKYRESMDIPSSSARRK